MKIVASTVTYIKRTQIIFKPCLGQNNMTYFDFL